MRPIIIEVQKYEANNGSVFDTKDEAIHCDKLEDGTRRICSSCVGSGKLDPYGDGHVSMTCTDCGGNGWQEKVEVWQ